MRRRQAVKSDVTSIASSAPAPTVEKEASEHRIPNDSDAAQLNSPPSAASVPSNGSAAVPSMDLFSRFQSKSGDFTSWNMLEEEQATDFKPISAEVASKLRKRQDMLRVRAGALPMSQIQTGSSGSAHVQRTEWDANTKNKRVRPQDTDEDDEEAKGVAKSESALGLTAANDDGLTRSGTDLRRSAPGKRNAPPAQDKRSQSGSSTTTGGEKRAGGISEESEDGDGDMDSDEDYMPASYKDVEVNEVRKVEGKKSSKIAKPTASAPSPVADLPDVLEDVAGRADTEETGIQGDYLNFLPAAAAGKFSTEVVVDKGELLAVVNVAGDVAKTIGGSHSPLVPQSNRWHSSSAGNTAPSTPSSTRREKGAKGGRKEELHTATVPLWSAKRLSMGGSYCKRSALIALHQEIMDLLDFLRPTYEEVRMRRGIEMRIASFATKLWPGCEPFVFGSLHTHLLLPRSDVDITILNVPVSQEEALTALAREIQQADMCHAAYPQVILKTKVPLVKFQAKHSLIDVDISINAADGKTNTEVVISLLRQFPEAQPLIILIKYFLEQRGMHEPYHGGLGSFGTVILVISFLQHHPMYNDKPAQRAYTGLGKLLVDFFLYYGSFFSYNRYGISILNGGFYFNRSDNQQQAGSPTSPMGRGPMGPAQLFLEDPGNPANNAASSLRTFHSISSSFLNAYAALTADFELPANGLAELSPDSPDIACRPTLLSRILHVDAESLNRRHSIHQAYVEMANNPDNAEFLEELKAFKAEEDLPMIEGKSWARASPLTKQEQLQQQQQQKQKQSELQSASPNYFGGSLENYDMPPVRGFQSPDMNDMGGRGYGRMPHSPDGAPPTRYGNDGYRGAMDRGYNNNNNNNNNNHSSGMGGGNSSRFHGGQDYGGMRNDYQQSHGGYDRDSNSGGGGGGGGSYGQYDQEYQRPRMYDDGGMRGRGRGRGRGSYGGRGGGSGGGGSGGGAYYNRGGGGGGRSPY